MGLITVNMSQHLVLCFGYKASLSHAIISLKRYSVAIKYIEVRHFHYCYNKLFYFNAFYVSFCLFHFQNTTIFRLPWKFNLPFGLFSLLLVVELILISIFGI